MSFVFLAAFAGCVFLGARLLPFSWTPVALLLTYAVGLSVFAVVFKDRVRPRVRDMRANWADD